MVIKKKYLIISLIFIALIGSFINFYLTNLVMNAIANKQSPGFLGGLFMPIGALMIAIEFVLFAFFILRYYLHPTHLKKMMLVYSIVLISLSFIGLIAITLSIVLVYKSILKPYPFTAALIVFLTWHAVMVGLGFLSIFVFRKKVKLDDVFLHKTTVKYVFQTIAAALIVYYAFNRFGALLWAPVYAQVRTLDITYPFYILIGLPMILLVIDMLYMFRIFKSKHRNVGVTISYVLLVMSLFIIAQFSFRSLKDQAFLSAISPAVPIERLMTIPIDSFMNTAEVVVLAIFTIVNSHKFKKLKDKELLAYKELRNELNK